MNQPLRRSPGWLLLGALALAVVWTLLPTGPSPGPATSPPPLIVAGTVAPARETNSPATAATVWNRWRSQLPAAQPAVEDVTEWPAQRSQPFEAFREWQARYRVAADKTALEAEGAARARDRRAAMARWIERDPEFALAQAVGPDARRDLPAAVLAELERLVDGRGHYLAMVRCGENVRADQQFSRQVRIGEAAYAAFVYGRRYNQMTKYDVPLHGVALDGRLALHESPVRQLDPLEAQAQGLNAQAIHLETGGQVRLAMSAQDAFAIEASLMQREAGRGPYTAAMTGSVPLPPGTAAFPPSPGWSLGVKRFLVIRVDFSDDPGGPFDRQTGQVITTTTISSVMNTVNQFYLDNSQGQTSIATTILPAVLRMPQTKAAYDALTPDDLRTDMLAAALQYDQANGNTGQFDPATYDLDTVVFSDLSGANWQFGGLAFLGAKGMWVNAEFDLRILAHELGHNYGLQHANRWDVTGTDPIDPAGTHNEYGDEYDMMGGNTGAGGNRPIHFNEWYKAYLGWLNSSQWRTAPTGGVYRLFRHDHTNASGIRGITLGQQSDRAYWLGFRRDLTNYAANSFGATNFLANGVEVRWGMQPPGLASDMDGNGSRLLNMTPATANFTRHPLGVGQTFTDPAFNLSITPVSVGGTSPNQFIDLNISYSTPPVTIIQDPTNLTVFAGATVSFDVVVTGTGPISYQWTYNGATIPGATSSNLTLVNVTTNQGGTYLVRVTNPGGTIPSQPAILTVLPVPINLLTNGGFELPVLAATTNVTGGDTNILGWSITGTSPMFFLSGSSQGVVPHDGTQMVSFNVSDSPPGNTLSQTFATTPGQAYAVTYYVSRGGGGLGTVSLRATVTSATGVPLALLDSPAPLLVGWSPVQTLFFAATTTTTTLTFLDTSLVTTSVDVFLDDVTIAPAAPGAPVITTPPLSLSVVAGSSATLTVGASGTPPLAYQWLFNGVAIPGATSATLSLLNVQATNAGDYSVRVSNGLGTSTSIPATLTVITYAPVAHWKFDEAPGSTVAVDSRGSFNGTNATFGAAFVPGGRSGNALSLDAAANGYVNFGNNLMMGGSDFTVSAWVKTPPGDPTVFATFVSKHNANFANGYFLSYNHSVIPGSAGKALFYAGTRTILVGGFSIVDVPVSSTSVNDGNWHQITGIYRAGGTTTVYVDGAPLEGSITSSPITPNTVPFLVGGVTYGTTPTGTYSGLVDDVQIYNRALVDSEIDYLYQNPGQEVTGAPIIAAQPQSAAVVLGGSVTFAVTNIGSSPFTYQWRFKGAVLNGATGPTLTLNNVQTNQAGDYTVRIDNAQGFAVSSNATLTVLVPAFVVGHPTNRTVLAGSNVNFTVTVGGTPPFSYQWRFNGADIPGATAPSVLVPNAQITNAGLYSVLVANPYGTALSSNAVLVVNSPPVILNQPVSRVASVAAPVDFTVGVAGSSPFAYQWRFNGTPIPGATGATHGLSGVVGAHAGFYSAVITNAYGAATSSVATLTILPSRVYSPWGATAGGAGSDVGNAVAVDANGNVFVAGYFTGTATFGTNQLVSAGVRDGFLAKYDPAGQVLWVRRMGGTGFDTVNALAVDAAGNTYVAGSFEGTATFGTAALTNTSPASFADAFAVKFDANGTNVWARRLGVAATGDFATALALDGAGNVFIAGQSSLASFNSVTLTNHGRVFLAKYDNAGNPLWARKAGGGGAGQFDQATALAADSVGNVYLAGVFASGTATFDGGVALTNRGGFDSFVARYDSAGTVQWVQQLGGTQDDRANGVAVDSAGNAYLVGEFAGTLQLPGTNLVSADADQNLFVARLTPAGTVDWARAAGGSLQDAARAVTVDRNDNVFVAGYFSGSATFGPDTLASVANTFDAFFARLDTNGNFAFAQQAGGGDLGGDFALAVAADANGNALLTGYFNGASALGNRTAASTGGEDVFLTRFNAFAGDAPPALGARPAAGQLRLSWPLGSSSFILQAAPDLRPQSWTDVLGVLGVETNEFAMTNQITLTNRFFRLRKP